MEKHYIAYTKEIAGEKFYFVKAFISFPELDMTAQMLNGYGMHKDFNEACNIAGVDEPAIRQQIKNEIQDPKQQAIVIDMNDALQSKRISL